MRYTSPLQILGIPLIDVRVADPTRGPARGWIAIGDIAVGLFAIGGVAAGGIAIGGVAVGVIPLGGLGIGGFAIGGAAIGFWAFGGGAIALYAAFGGLAIATQYAIGGYALAAHANDAAALEYFAAMPFQIIRGLLMHSRWLILLAFLPILTTLRRRNA